MKLSKYDVDRIISMAWEDRTPFDAIYKQFNIKENQVRRILRRNLKLSSFIMWRKRVKGRKQNTVLYRIQPDSNLKIKKTLTNLNFSIKKIKPQKPQNYLLTSFLFVVPSL